MYGISISSWSAGTRRSSVVWRRRYACSLATFSSASSSSSSTPSAVASHATTSWRPRPPRDIEPSITVSSHSPTDDGIESCAVGRSWVSGGSMVTVASDAYDGCPWARSRSGRSVSDSYGPRVAPVPRKTAKVVGEAHEQYAPMPRRTTDSFVRRAPHAASPAMSARLVGTSKVTITSPPDGSKAAWIATGAGASSVKVSGAV